MVERVLRRHLGGPSTLLVAASGGVDSTALLLLVAAVARRRDLGHRIVVGHVDHAVRAEGPEECEVVSKLAAAVGLRFLERRLLGESSRSAADLRRRRWDAFESMAAECDAAAILTGHHADDQAETLLMRLARGTGTAGLAGIPEARETPEGRLVLRPLLDASRSALSRLVEASGLETTNDPTNARSDLPRGLIRHEVMPRLERLYPGAAGRIASAARDLADEQRGMDEPAPLRWTRLDCRRLGERGTATRVRSAVRSHAGPAVDTVSRAVWISVARAVLDDDVHPRRIEVLSGCTVEIGPQDVLLSLQPQESSS